MDAVEEPATSVVALSTSVERIVTPVAVPRASVAMVADVVAALSTEVGSACHTGGGLVDVVEEPATSVVALSTSVERIATPG